MLKTEETAGSNNEAQQRLNRDREMRGLTARALQHWRNGTTDQAPATLRMPVGAYRDPQRYALEVDRVFKHLPLALALSVEVPNSGDYRALSVLGVPVLIVRGKDGTARAFLNVCRHRGARLCDIGRGNARVFSCPYHAWVYDDHGALVGRYGADSFGEVDANEMGLTPLPCAERAGLIFVGLTVGDHFDIDQWLGAFAAELETLQLGDWYVYEQRELEGPSWKIALDGYLEAYHHNSLHGKTVGKLTLGNLLVLDTFGPHQRLTFGRKSLGELSNKPEDQWTETDCNAHIRLIHNCFPNLSISGILGDHCLVSQIFPGPTMSSTITRQTVLVAKQPVTAAERAMSANFSAMVLQAVRDEDYAVGGTIQQGLHSQANEYFVFGRNEPAVQNYHRTIARLMGQNEP